MQKSMKRIIKDPLELYWEVYIYGVREISRFYVATPRVFPLYVRARFRASMHLFIHKYLHLSSILGKHLFKLPEVLKNEPHKTLTELH